MDETTSATEPVESGMDLLDYTDDEEEIVINCHYGKSLSVPEEVTGFLPFRLSACEKLEEIRLPAALWKVRPLYLRACTALRRIEVHPDNPWYSSRDGVLYNKSGTELAFLPPAAADSYVFPESVTAIGTEACVGILSESFTVPGRVRRIGVCAFEGCRNLKAVTLEEGVQVIECCAFQGCGLREIAFPASLEVIEDYAFSQCAQLRRIRFSEGLRSLGDCVFQECSALDAFPGFPDTVEELGESIFWECPELPELPVLPLPKALKKLTPMVLDSGAAAYSISEENLSFRTKDGILMSRDGEILISFPSRRTGAYSIPPQVRCIGPHAFENSALSTLDIPPTVESIGDFAFSGSALQAVVLPSGVRKIPYCAFLDCSELRQVLLPEIIEAIGEHGFSSCSKLEAVSIPESCRSVENGAFSDCPRLGQVMLRSPDLELAPDAFRNSPKVWFPIPPKEFPSIRTRNRSILHFCRLYFDGKVAPRQIRLYADYIDSHRKKLENLAKRKEILRDFLALLEDPGQVRQEK